MTYVSWMLRSINPYSEFWFGLALVVGGVLTALILPNYWWALPQITGSFVGVLMILHGSERLSNDV